MFYTFDPQGSTAQRLDGAGTVLASSIYEGFGTGLSTGSSDSYGYGARWGYYNDTATGLTQCMFRYLDPSSGRWLNRDPIGYAGGINVYAYVRNSPVVRFDPRGESDAAALDWARLFTTAGGFAVIDGPLPFGDLLGGGILVGGGGYLIWKHWHDNQPYCAKPSRNDGRKPKSDYPDWIKDKKGERGNQDIDKWLEKVLDEKYGKGNWKKGGKTEWNKAKKGLEDEARRANPKPNPKQK